MSRGELLTVGALVALIVGVIVLALSVILQAPRTVPDFERCETLSGHIVCQ